MLDPDLGRFVRELLDGQGANLSPPERLIVIALARHADGSGVAYPSVGLLARETGYERRTVMRNLRKLENDKKVIATSLNASPLETNIYQFRSFGRAASSKPSSGQTATSSVPATATGSSPSPTSDAASTQTKEAIPPQGKAPSEYQYKYMDKEKLLLRKRMRSRDLGDSVPSPENSHQDRVHIDREVARQEWEDARLRLSYFIADQLIASGVKKLRYRDDAASEEWLGGADRILFEAEVPAKASLREVEQAIIIILGSEEGQWVRRPGDIHSSIVDALRALKAESESTEISAEPEKLREQRSVAERIDEFERRRRRALP